MAWWKCTWWKWTIGSWRPYLPMWLLLVLVAFPTAFFWWRDSKRVRAKPPRSLRLMKLGAIFMCVLLGLMWVASMQGGVTYHSRLWSFSLGRSLVSLNWDSGPDPVEKKLSDSPRGPARLEFKRTAPGSLSQQLSLFLPMKHVVYLPLIHHHATFIHVPLWVIGLPLAFLTGILWWLDRRYVPPGYCRRCRYDLTGNTSGRCPECGTMIPGRDPVCGKVEG